MQQQRMPKLTREFSSRLKLCRYHYCDAKFTRHAIHRHSTEQPIKKQHVYFQSVYLMSFWKKSPNISTNDVICIYFLHTNSVVYEFRTTNHRFLSSYRFFALSLRSERNNVFIACALSCIDSRSNESKSSFAEILAHLCMSVCKLLRWVNYGDAEF